MSPHALRRLNANAARYLDDGDQFYAVGAFSCEPRHGWFANATQHVIIGVTSRRLIIFRRWPVTQTRVRGVLRELPLPTQATWDGTTLSIEGERFHGATQAAAAREIVRLASQSLPEGRMPPRS